MKIMEIQDRRQVAPNVKTVSKGVFQQFVSWFRAGLGLGLMLFVALTTFSRQIAIQIRYPKYSGHKIRNLGLL